MPQLIDVIIPKNEIKTGAYQNVFLILSYEESDVRNAINMGVFSGISHNHIKLIFYNLLCAVKYMHSGNVMHRDLKPGNILINGDCQVKICDFGISRTLP